MKNVISTILFVALSLSINAQTVGFNFGQIYSFITSQYGEQKELPKEVIKLIDETVPSIYLESVRFSGTMSNYMTIGELGYGEHPEVYGQWTMLQNRLNARQKLDLLVLALRSDMKGVVKMFSPFVKQSYVVNFVNSVRQLGIKRVHYTFNSHTPYRGIHTLDQSLETLKYVYESTNLASVELENETYDANYIVGTADKNEKKSRSTMEPYFKYLENEVVPAIYTIIPKDVPIGLSITNNDNAKRKAYNKLVMETADRLISKGYRVYLAPHFYFKDAKEKTIEKDIDEIIKITGGKYELKITEFNVDSKAGNMKQGEVIEFIERVVKIGQKRGINDFFYHTILTKKGAHFSFIK